MILFKKLFILFLVFCLVFLIGCGESSNPRWNSYQVFSNNLLQAATNNNENNNNNETEKENLSIEQYKEYTICFSENPQETTGKFDETEFITYNSDENHYFFGEHMINNSESSKRHLLNHLNLNSLNDAINRTYNIKSVGYLGDNNILYLKISEVTEK